MKRLVSSILVALFSAVSSEAANIYWVSFHSDDNTPSAAAATAGFTNAPDAAYTQLLRANGHTVTRVLTSGTPDTNLLNTADLVIISRSVVSGDYELDDETAAWNGITAPTMILSGYIIRQNRLGLMAGTTIPDTAGPVKLTALVPSHPIFAGISLDAGNTMVNNYALSGTNGSVTFTNNPQRGISVVTGATAGSGTVLATVAAGDPNAAGGMVIGEWQAGATMSTAPPDTLGGHRLVFLTGTREQVITAEGAGIYDLTADGAKLFLNAVKYMARLDLTGVTVQDPGNVVGTGSNAWSYLILEGEDFDSEKDSTPGVGFIRVTADGAITNALGNPVLGVNTTASMKGALFAASPAFGLHADKATYKVLFSQPGTYYLYMRFTMFENGGNLMHYLNEDSFFLPPDFNKDPQTDWPLTNPANGANGGYTEGCCDLAGFLRIPSVGDPTRVDHGSDTNFWEGNFHWNDLLSSQFLVSGLSGEPAQRFKYEVTPGMVGVPQTFTVSYREGGSAIDLFLFSTHTNLLNQYTQEDLDRLLLGAGPFIPSGVASAGLTNLVPDRIIFNAATPNNDNWEPNISVLGNSTFLIEANTFATDGVSQRYALAFQPTGGGPNATGEVFFADNGAPYRDQINLSRQNGNPGRVAGDKRPGAVNLIGGGEASLYGFPAAFNSDGRFNPSSAFYTFLAGANGRDGCIQISSLNPTTLAQTSRSKALDSAFGRLTNSTPPAGASTDQISRFGGEVAGLDNGNFVSVVEDRSRLFNPNANAAVATIFRPDGSIAKDAFKVADGDLWSNLAAFRGGFCIRVAGTLYFFDNDGNQTSSTNQAGSGVNFDGGRGDGTRIAAHINSPYVFLAGNATTAAGDPIATRIAVFDSRTRAFVAATNVSEIELTNVAFDRVNLAADALDRVTVAYEVTLRFGDPPTPGQQQVVARVLAFDGTAKTFSYSTPSFYPFVNFDTAEAALIRTLRPSVAMTTRQICIAAKGEINSTNNPAAGPDTQRQTTFYTVITHPDPQNDPTAPVGGPAASPGEQLFDDPAGGWTYVLNGSSATAGPGGVGFTSLDGTWNHDNGSDTWDGSAIGGALVVGTNAPGGVSSIDGYLRIQDPGDPRNPGGFADPGNRKIYFGHDITAEGAPTNILNSGVTLHFRARVATAGVLDDRYITAPTNYPAGGDGYVISDGGKGNFGVKQASGGIISFSLATVSDTGTNAVAGLVMNNRNGTAISGVVDTGEAGTLNLLPLDPTLWHEFWIVIQADTTGQGTHKVDIYLDGSLTPRTFYVTAGDGSDFTGISYIAMGTGNTTQSGAFDIDYYTYKIGALAPTGSAVPVFTSASIVGNNIVGTWAGGRPPYTIQGKADLGDTNNWVDLATGTNTSAAAPATGVSTFYRLVNHIVFTVSLNGANERPSPVTTTATGSGTVTLDGNKVTVDVNYSGLSANLSAVHFHGPGTSEEATNVIINLLSLNTGTTSGSIKGSVTVTNAQHLKWLLNGLLYLNIHTGTNPGGEIRGQLPAVQKLNFVARLNGANERLTPVTNTVGQGAATLVLDNNQLKLDLNYYGLSGPPSQAHIHGPATIEEAANVLQGINGLAVGTLGTSGRYSGVLTLKAAEILYLLNGLTYLNIHTATNPGGEIRGQIMP